ncbi:type II toxin-antitoxin system RelE/ParE family toxin [Phreatobacter stygius]|uniref:type II toxin-antitoxin system RelE/ParE family toxin n=1 Tax=Phreatobacter stygius TaxID=1940610 RepID=UPI00319E7A49
MFWTPEALDDRRAIYDYVEAANPSAALGLDELFSQKASGLLDHPGLGRPGRVAATRELVAHQNYILIYDTAGDLVRILRLLHVARQWPPARTVDEARRPDGEPGASSEIAKRDDPP